MHTALICAGSAVAGVVAVKGVAYFWPGDDTLHMAGQIAASLVIGLAIGAVIAAM